ncbi:MAG: ABC transporter ATP-binding protein [Faecousia sp.]
MAEIELSGIVKIYPFAQVRGLLGRKKQQELLAKQKAMPHTTNEGVVVLQKINLSIQPGEFVVILGPSGCGKTTLLRLIAGLEEPSLGEVRFDGKVMNGLPPEERDVAMVFQNYSLYPHLTAFDNIAFPLRNLHIPRGELEETVRHMAGLLQIEQCLDRLPSELSGGQLQRIAIARALVRKPQVFLMDEPFSNLDAPLRASLRAIVKRLHQELGTTFLYVTHDQNEALSLGERILVMREGQIVQDGSAAEVYNRPGNCYVASTVGAPQMNLFPVRAEGDGTFRLLGKRFILPDCLRTLRGDFQVGIRPVHFSLEEGIRARLTHAEHLGTESVLHLKQGDTEFTVVLEADEAEPLRRGQEVSVVPMEKKFHFFDLEGNRIM